MITDIVIIAVLLISIAVGFYKGFATSSLEFLSSILSLIASYFIAGIIATFAFDTFFRQDLIDGFYTTVQGIATDVPVSTLVNQFLADINADFLQIPVNEFVSNLGVNVIAPTMEGATVFVDTIIRPFAEILIGFVAFIILFIILRILIKSVAKSLELVNKIPLIGMANKLFGLVSGAVIGVIYSTLVTFLIIVVGLVADSPTVTQNLITDSKIVSTTLNFVINFVN